MRILSYNIHKGFSFANRRFVLARIRELLRATDVDLVFLQEVLGQHRGHARRHADWPPASQFEYLADSIWPHHAYGRNAIYDEGHHGNAILGKQPFAAWGNIDVSTNPFERRGLLHATTAMPGLARPLHLVCLHLDLHEYGRRQQIDRLVDHIGAAVPADCPLIIAGDLNDWRQVAGRAIEQRLGMVEAHKTVHGASARSFPSWRPLLRLDRIYLRGLRAVDAGCLAGAEWKGLSDHAAVWAEVEG